VGKEIGTCFINLSGTSLSDESVYSCIQKQLKYYNLPPELVCFEITETAVISNLGVGLDFIKGIKDKGSCFALDDFGTGLSSFSYLKSIPVDYLKIDGGFVQGMLDDPMDCAIVEAINQIAHVVGLNTIAESIENDKTLAMLHSMGVDYAQGYGIERPGPLDSA
jgi:EAL domain-containing protein (putative c-di-GMP-specific phosphodiesterase class I)